MISTSICVGSATGVVLLGQLLPLCLLGSSISLLLAAAVLWKRNHAIRSTVPLPPNTTSNVRVAIVTSSHNRGYYVQPVFRELARAFPRTVLFTGRFPGFLPNCRHSFEVHELPGTRNFVANEEIVFRWLPVSLIKELFRAHPEVILIGQFTLWTSYVVFYKLFCGCRILFLWDGTAPSCAYLHSPLRLLWRRTLGRFVDIAISNTHEGVRYLNQIIHIPGSKIRQGIHLVADVDSLCCECRAGEIAEIPGPHPIFLYVGSLSKRKGVRSLVEAAKKLSEQGLTNFSVILVGEGPQQELRQAISGGLDAIVHVMGEIKYSQLGKYYRACDVFVLPCREDVWGMVVPEAMAFGKAILCSTYANAKELVQHGTNGFVFDPLSPDELTSYMAQIVRNPHLSTQFGQASTAIISKYTPATAAAHIAGAITELVLYDRDTAAQQLV